METVTSEIAVGSPGPAWHERRVVRWLSVVVIAVGVGLLVFGVSGLMSASDTDATAASTEDQVAALRDETAALETDRDAALAGAEEVAAEATQLTTASIAVQSTADDLELVYARAVEASNAMAACGESAATDAEFLQCTRDTLGGFQATTTELETATAALRDAIADLEGKLP